MYIASNGRPEIPVHAAYMARGKKTADRKEPVYRPNFIRAWREHRDISLEELAAKLKAHHGIKTTHASLSRIERGKQPYSQPILEALAEELSNGDVAALLQRDPEDAEQIWGIWDKAKPEERSMIVELARTLTKPKPVR